MRRGLGGNVIRGRTRGREEIGVAMGKITIRETNEGWIWKREC